MTEKVEDGIQGGEPKMPGGRGSSQVVDRAGVVNPTKAGRMWSVIGTGAARELAGKDKRGPDEAERPEDGWEGRRVWKRE